MSGNDCFKLEISITTVSTSFLVLSSGAHGDTSLEE